MLRFGHPAQNGLDGKKTRLVGLADQGEQLKPQIVVRPLHELSDCARRKIGHRHRGAGGPQFEAAAKAVAALDTLDAFLKSYKQVYGQDAPMTPDQAAAAVPATAAAG